MANARILYIDDINNAKQEIIKTGVDAPAVNWLYPKALHMVVRLEDISSFAANVIKQEMLGKGGDAAVNKGVADCSIARSDVLLMGTYGQFERLVYKLGMQPGSLKKIAEEIQDVLDSVGNGKQKYFKCCGYKLPIGSKTYIMGILNSTPDSFSDGGKYNDPDSAVKRAKEMAEEGVDIIDVGGESTRPGYEPVSADEEIERAVPVIERLVKEIGVPVSIDTTKALVAEKALRAGASIVNDVWGLQKDPGMADVVSNHNAGVIMMHNSDDKVYNDLMGDITRFLRNSVSLAEKAGITRDSMIIDPGIGFGKTLDQNIEVLKKIKELKSLNLPVLLGTSRKSMIGGILDLPVSERIEGTAATVVLGIAGGVDIIRVHDVKEMARTAKMADAVIRGV